MTRVRVRIERVSILNGEQIQRMKNLDVLVSVLIGHVHSWGVAMRDIVFDEEKARLLTRCKSLESAIRVAPGSCSRNVNSARWSPESPRTC